jgi:hypothetical protein
VASERRSKTVAVLAALPRTRDERELAPLRELMDDGVVLHGLRCRARRAVRVAGDAVDRLVAGVGAASTP